MPELPEVETTLRGIEPHILNLPIERISIRESKLRWKVPKKDLKENLLYSNIFSEIISRKILYIAMFFHDLGKGTGRDHSIVSSEIAKEFCSHLEMDQTEKNTIIWLIRNHLLMNKIYNFLFFSNLWISNPIP